MKKNTLPSFSLCYLFISFLVHTFFIFSIFFISLKRELPFKKKDFPKSNNLPFLPGSMNDEKIIMNLQNIPFAREKFLPNHSESIKDLCKKISSSLDKTKKKEKCSDKKNSKDSSCKLSSPKKQFDKNKKKIKLPDSKNDLKVEKKIEKIISKKIKPHKKALFTHPLKQIQKKTAKKKTKSISNKKDTKNLVDTKKTKELSDNKKNYQPDFITENNAKEVKKEIKKEDLNAKSVKTINLNTNCWGCPVGLEPGLKSIFKIFVDNNGYVKTYDSVEDSVVKLFDLSIRQKIKEYKFDKEYYGKSVIISFSN